MSEEVEGTPGPKLVEAPITINIGNITDGAAFDAFNAEMDKVIRNIMDPSTEARTKRKITLKWEFHPREDRIQINTQFTCTSKLAGVMPSTSRMFIGKDEEGGLVPLIEDPRQMNIFAAPKVAPVAPPIIFSGKK